MTNSNHLSENSSDVIAVYEKLLEDKRLIVLSNRGPAEHQVSADGQLHARRGTGGVVTAMNLLTHNLEFTWIASAMGEGDRRIADTAEGESVESPIPAHRVNLRYVVTPRRVYHKYYNVFCNPLLWFLQHYMWSSPYTPNVDPSVHDAWKNGYIAVNKAFADAVIEEAQSQRSRPVVMVHDYHLYMVPLSVRQAVPDALITHFTHIPWPSPAYWLLVPDYVRSAICRSLCQCDIVGFQSNRDARSFLTTCEEFVTDSKVDYVASTVTLDGHVTRVRAYPISIDPEELTRIAASPRTIDYERRLETLCLEKTIVRVDRLEPSKNVVRGFRAYELMLEQHPELHGTVTYLAFLAPSRTRVRQYQRYGDEVEEVVQRINRAYGTETWSPIHTFYENNYTQAVAGLKLYDVLVVNSVIDGMNLVAKEGPIVNTRNGVLVLSEAVGAHEQLRRGALSVSPTDIEGTANAMYTAVTMSEVERAQRAETLRNNVTTENVAHWLKIQAEDLLELTS